MTHWSTADFIDLEYFFAKDREAGASSRDVRHRSDRDLYLDAVPDSSPAPDDRTLLKIWLNHRRAAFTARHNTLPGDLFGHIYSWCGGILLLFGVLIGAGMAGAALSYSGSAPLNISVYLAALVLPQTIFLIISWVFIVHRALRSLGGKAATSMPLNYRLFRFILSHAMATGLRKLFANVSPDRIMGMVKSKSRVYGQIFFWPVHQLTQRFAIGFNSGAIFLTIFKVIGSDLAFGWQTTLSAGSETVYTIVQIISVPWRWFIETPTAHPTLSQIEGSRIILKDGIRHLTTPDLVAWWPFLLAMVITYGLIPRLFMLGLGALQWRRATARTPLSHEDCVRTVARMKTPMVNTRASSTLREATQLENNHLQNHETARNTPPTIADTPWIILVPEDIWNEDKKTWQNMLHRHLGQTAKNVVSVDMDTDLPSLSENQCFEQSLPMGPVLLIQEAFQPPIAETIDFIKAVQSHQAPHLPLVIGLVGKPGKTPYPRPSENNTSVWKDQIQKLGAPYIMVQEMGGS